MPRSLMPRRVRRSLTLLGLLAWLAAGCGGEDPPAMQPAHPRAASVRPSGTNDVPAPTRPSENVLTATVRDYYRELDRKDFAAAWSRLSPRLRGRLGGYDAWHAGYRTTDSVTAYRLTATPDGTKRGSVDVDLRAVDTDACGRKVSQRFTGSWTLTRRGGRWVATEIRMQRVAGVPPAVEVSACATPNSNPDDDSTPAPPDADRGSEAESVELATTVCYPAVRLPEVRLAAVDIPPVTLPAFTVNGRRYPARHLPGRHIPGRTIPGRTLQGGCFSAPASFAPSHTTVRVSGYDRLDPNYSHQLTSRYWAYPDVSTPDPTAPGFGEFNAAGYPRNQYVRPYVRRDGTMVSGYWRNSPNDGLPTCRVISC